MLKNTENMLALFVYVSTHYVKPAKNSLTSIDMLSYLGVQEVTHRTAVCESRVQLPALEGGFIFCFVLIVVFSCLSKTHYLSCNCAIPFAMLIYSV